MLNDDDFDFGDDDGDDGDLTLIERAVAYLGCWLLLWPLTAFVVHWLAVLGVWPALTLEGVLLAAAVFAGAGVIHVHWSVRREEAAQADSGRREM